MIALISDTHGNVSGLEAVLADIEGAGPGFLVKPGSVGLPFAFFEGAAGAVNPH